MPNERQPIPQLTPEARAAAEQARQTLASTVPLLPPSPLRNLLHGALREAERTLGMQHRFIGRRERRTS